MVVALLLVLWAAQAHAVDVTDIPSIQVGQSPNPVGSGARATGMGGAFIAVADDATAASWNPAGLVQLERPEVSAVGSYNYRSEDIRSGSHPELNGENLSDSSSLNYLSAVLPFRLFDRNMVVSLNYQKLFDFNMDFKGSFFSNFNDGLGDVFDLKEKDVFRQRGELTTISPAFAVELTPNLSVGLTFNVWTNMGQKPSWQSSDSIDFNMTGTIIGIPFDFTGNLRSDEKDYFYGNSYNVGVLYSPTPTLTLGAVYKSRFTANIRREVVETDATYFTMFGITVPALDIAMGKQYLKLTMPESYGIGAAYRASDRFTIALDVYRTEWSEFILNTDGLQTRPNVFALESQSKMKATVQVRMGGEYLIIKPKYVIPVRAGVFYDPEPSENNPNTYYGIAVGTGISYDKVSFDVAYTFRTGKTGESLGVSDTNSNIIQHAALFSVIYRF